MAAWGISSSTGWKRMWQGSRAARRSWFLHTYHSGGYQDWGWGTDDGERTVGYLKRFWVGDGLGRPHPSDHTEDRGERYLPCGHSDRLAAAKPGAAACGGPMAVPAEKLHTLLGLTQVRYVHGENPLAIVGYCAGGWRGAERSSGSRGWLRQYRQHR